MEMMYGKYRKQKQKMKWNYIVKSKLKVLKEKKIKRKIISENLCGIHIYSSIHHLYSSDFTFNVIFQIQSVFINRNKQFMYPIY